MQNPSEELPVLRVVNVDKERKNVMVSQDLKRLPIHQIEVLETHTEMPKKGESQTQTSTAFLGPIWGRGTGLG